MQLFVGVHSDRGSIKKFAFDLLEMPVTLALPKSRTLREMKQSRPSLKFSLRLHPDVAQEGATHADIERTVQAAEALEADVIVVPTGPRFTPTDRHRRMLGEIASKLHAEGRHVAWEPRGVWVPEEAEGLAGEHGLLLVRDVTREPAPAGPVIYTRLLPFGFGARLSQNALEQLAEQIEGTEVAYVVVQSEGAKRAHTSLRELFELEGE
jgi:uncharacterized protein YecE (DUF72 family)